MIVGAPIWGRRVPGMGRLDRAPSWARRVPGFGASVADVLGAGADRLVSEIKGARQQIDRVELALKVATGASVLGAAIAVFAAYTQRRR